MNYSTKAMTKIMEINVEDSSATSESEDSESVNQDDNPANLKRSQRTNRGVPPDRYTASTKLVKITKEDSRSRKKHYQDQTIKNGKKQ